MHLGAIYETATWPAVTCHQQYDAFLITRSLEIVDGTTPVLEAPGLGVELDCEVLTVHETERPDEQPTPPRFVRAD